MTAEINSLKKEHRGAANKTNKSTTMGKKPAAKTTKEQKKTKDAQKKKATNKWAWKSKPPKDNDSKEDNTFVKSFESTKYFWCPNHNNGAGIWTLHHPKDCKAWKASTGTTAKAHITTFDTVDSDLDMEWRLRQNQALSWLWLAISNSLLWLVLPEDVGMSLAAFCLTTVLVFILILESYTQGGPKPYMLKKHRPPKSLRIKSLLKALNWCTMATMKIIINI